MSRFLKNEDTSIPEHEAGTKPIKRKKCSKHIIHGVKWIKKSVVTYNGCQGFSSVCVDEVVIQQGDHIMLEAEGLDEPLRVATVVYMYHSPTEGPMFHAHLFCRGTETILGEIADPRELFVVDDCDDYPVGCIIKKAVVEFKKNPENWTDLGGENCLPVELEDNENIYFFFKNI
ncbi:hypothetical protein NQ317_000123 [Molorchus minor]|uniref:BAH domain-containing protein n=1 Tax=Molorchus minor TaxID=1323400 RepID=A0ABQ9JTT2_9CUCU|nr:hypothetical protein NQ317_000123 [Molorchus minor]